VKNDLVEKMLNWENPKTFVKYFDLLRQQGKLPYKKGGIVFLSKKAVSFFWFHNIKLELNTPYIILNTYSNLSNSVNFSLLLAEDNTDLEKRYYHPIWFDKILPPTEASKVLYIK
jgi:hypothetical protein